MATLQEALAARTREAAPELIEHIDRDRLRCYACGHQCPIPTARSACARFASTRRAGCTCRGATSAACSATRSRRSRSSTPIPARSPTASACSAATCTAATARTGSRRRRCAIRRPLRRRATPPRASLVAGRLAAGGARSWSRPTTSRSSPSSGRSRSSRKRASAGWSPGSCPTATAPRRCSTTCGRTSISTRSTSRASTTATIASWAAGCSRSSTPSPGCTRAGVWVEIVTLLIPGFNDSDEELRRLTAFIAGVSPDIPWHVTAFHQDYRMTDPAQHHGGHAAAGRRDWPRRRAALRLRRQPPGRVGALEAHPLPRLRRAPRRPLRLLHSGLSPDPRRRLPVLRNADPGRWSAGFEGNGRHRSGSSNRPGDPGSFARRCGTCACR